jgi:mannosyl-3-phosphoglycerate phosphatase family protein
MRLVIVTDLDGTLLDVNTYAVGPATGALRRVMDLGVPLVLSSSKTRAEIEAIRGRAGIGGPFVVENGGAIIAPAGYFAHAVPGSVYEDDRVTVELGRPYAEIVDILRDVATVERVTVVGFADMTVGEVAADCGLPLLDAQLAKLRQYDEPFRLLGADPGARSRFLKALRRQGVRVVSGGRYDHATGDNDKGQAVTVLRNLFNEQGERVVMVGLGDGLNDMSMLRAVDQPIIIRSDSNGATVRLARKVSTAIITQASGPAGWAEAVTRLLDQWQSETSQIATGAGRERS